MTAGRLKGGNTTDAALGGASLAECERTIEHAFRAYAEAAVALRTIRAGRLYKKTHQSFDTYCRERWGWSRTQADRLIAAGEIHHAIHAARQVAPNGASLEPPRTEAAARELVPLRRDQDALLAAWRHVVEVHGPDPTARQAKEAVLEAMAATLAERNGQTEPTPERQEVFAQVADLLEVPVAYVRACAVVADLAPELVAAMRAGSVDVHGAIRRLLTDEGAVA